MVLTKPCFLVSPFLVSKVLCKNYAAFNKGDVFGPRLLAKLELPGHYLV